MCEIKCQTFALSAVLWKNEKFTLTKKNFVKSTIWLVKPVKPLLSRKFCQKSVRVNFRNFHTALHSVEKREILSHLENISSNQLFSNLFSKTVTFTKFLPKMCDFVISTV